jgi:hypothetical protein
VNRHITDAANSIGFASIGQYGIDRITAVAHPDLNLIEAQLEHAESLHSHMSVCLSAAGWRGLFAAVMRVNTASTDPDDDPLTADQIAAAADVLEKLSRLDDRENPAAWTHTPTELRARAADFFTPEDPA